LTVAQVLGTQSRTIRPACVGSVLLIAPGMGCPPGTGVGVLVAGTGVLVDVTGTVGGSVGGVPVTVAVRVGVAEGVRVGVRVPAGVEVRVAVGGVPVAVGGCGMAVRVGRIPMS
jgi:hypothetical protein